MIKRILLFLSFIFFVLFAFYFLKDVKSVTRDTFSYLKYSYKALNLSYEEKMKISFGVTYKYAQFIKENTPPDATILIPPQGYPWAMTGNVFFFRYFLYPRKLINGEEKSPRVDLSEADVDYVLIDWGEYNQSEYGFTNGWPKFKVEADKIVLIEDFDAENPGLKTINQNFEPENEYYKNRWGLIKLK